jgi:hypothetical protein
VRSAEGAPAGSAPPSASRPWRASRRSHGSHSRVCASHPGAAGLQAGRAVRGSGDKERWSTEQGEGRSPAPRAGSPCSTRLPCAGSGSASVRRQEATRRVGSPRVRNPEALSEVLPPPADIPAGGRATSFPSSRSSWRHQVGHAARAAIRGRAMRVVLGRGGGSAGVPRTWGAGLSQLMAPRRDFAGAAPTCRTTQASSWTSTCRGSGERSVLLTAPRSFPPAPLSLQDPSTPTQPTSTVDPIPAFLPPGLFPTHPCAPRPTRCLFFLAPPAIASLVPRTTRLSR